MKTINKCELCGEKKLYQVLDLGNHPLCDDLIPIGKSESCKEYPIIIDFCKKCKTGFQRFQVKKEILFPLNYHYRARMTASVLQFMAEFVDSVDKYSPLKKNSLVLDIGCNDGSLLSIFKEKGCKTIGIDPTDAVLDARNSGHKVFHGFFNIELSKKLKEKGIVADYVTFTNVFAHIEDLNSLCKAVNYISDEKTLIVIENHYMKSIIDKYQFDTFYHEHPRTYSACSFKFIAEKLNKKLLFVEFPKRYGGNIRAFIGNRKFHSLIPELKLPKEDNFFEGLLNLKSSIKTWKDKTQKLIKSLIEENNGQPIPAKAFPGRAAILSKLLGLDHKMISAVYEIKGSIKTGNYVPGTRIPILPEKDLYSQNYLGPLLNFAWHLPSEVRENLKKNNFRGTVYDILDENLIK